MIPPLQMHSLETTTLAELAEAARLQAEALKKRAMTTFNQTGEVAVLHGRKLLDRSAELEALAEIFADAARAVMFVEKL